MKNITSVKNLLIVFVYLLCLPNLFAQMNSGKPPKSGKNGETKSDSKNDDKNGSLKRYLLGKDVNAMFPTEVNIFFGKTYSSLKYSSFDDFRQLYKEVYNKEINKFSPVISNTWGFNFRIAAVGIELGKIKSTFHTTANDDEMSGGKKGRREFNLEVDENNMAFFIGKRTKKKGYGLNIGGSFGKATLKPVFIDAQGNSIGGPQSYLDGVFKTKYQTITLGPEYYRGFGRIKLTFRYDWALKKLVEDNIYPNGLPIREDDIYASGPYGRYIPRNQEGFTTPNSKAGAGDGRMYVGSDIRCNRFSIRLTYSLIYKTMPGTKKKK